VQHRFILITGNFLLFSAAVQFCKGRYTNTSLWLWLWLWYIKVTTHSPRHVFALVYLMVGLSVGLLEKLQVNFCEIFW